MLYSRLTGSPASVHQSMTSPVSSEPAGATPAMRQYFDAKRQYRDAIVFFRMGDFYEMFYEDALTAARALELTLTSRSKDSTGGAIPMCGVPVPRRRRLHRAARPEGLPRRGLRADGGSEEGQGAGPARSRPRRLARHADRRRLSRRARAGVPDGARARRTPGPASASRCSISRPASSRPPSTPAPTARQALADELAVLRPREILAPAGFDDVPRAASTELRLDARVTPIDGWTFDFESARRTLLDQLQAQSLHGFGLDGSPGGASRRRRAGAVPARHAEGRTSRTSARSRSAPAPTACSIDPTTLRNLEVIEAADGGRTGSLLHEIDRTITPMGGRLLRAWLLRPLVALERIQDRLDAVEDFAFRATERAKLRDTLKSIHDIERLVARAALGTAGPRDLVVAAAVDRRGAARADAARRAAGAARPQPASRSSTTWPTCATRSSATLLDEPPALARDGGVIRDGVDPELDELRSISRSGKQRIAEMEEAERARTGISSLKIRYNRVFGYYIEISKSNLGNVPADYHRKQTIAGGERFITPALKEYEEKVLGADERILEREVEIFERAARRGSRPRRRASRTRRAALAALDVLAALAETAAVQQLHQAADARRRRADRHRRAPPGRRAARRRRVRAERRRRSTATTTSSIILTGPEHGRQVDLPAADARCSA